MERAAHSDANGAKPFDPLRLANAIDQLDRYIAYGRSDDVRGDPLAAAVGRAAAIQAFEFTYELSVRMIRRYLELTEPSSGTPKTMGFNNLLRLAFERDLVAEDLRGWLRFRDMRNATSHAYDEAIADDLYSDIPRFLAEARHLPSVLMTRRDAWL